MFSTADKYRRREDKEAFDYEFRMSKQRDIEMEKRVLKLTLEDFKDLI